MTFPTFAASDLIAETTDTVGTGTYSLRGALAGCFPFTDAFDDGSEVTYFVTDGPNVEAGTGTLTAGSPDTLSRTTILASSNGGAAVNWSGATRPIIRSASSTFGTGATALWSPTFFLAAPANGGRLPGASEFLFIIPLTYTAHLPLNFVGSIGLSLIQATASASFLIYKNTSVVGHLIFNGGSTTGVFSGGPIDLAVNDTFALVAPTPQDATLGDIYVAFFGTRDT